MATRTHVDSSVNERRLRPIYDCLDNGNNKKAIQEAEKVLKKQKDFQCAKVLKALALLRLGKHEDSGRLLHEVHAEVPTDDATLQAMTICYRELHRLDMIAEVYEAATQKDPQNEELLTHLFMAYVRLGEYKKQQQVALTLYKLKSKNPYYFWGVMSIVMQAHSASNEIAQKMLLPLAERMTEKFVRENKIEAEAEVQLYLLILELEHKYVEALNVLEGPLGEKITSFLNSKAAKKAQLLAKLEKWAEANAAYKALVIQNPDNWQFLCEYLSTSMKLIESNYQPIEINSETGQDFDYTLNRVLHLVLRLVAVEKTKENKWLRGPFLAHIRFVTLAMKNPEAFSNPQDLLVDLFKDYFARFGDKPCFFDDVRELLPHLEDQSKLKLLSEVKTLVGQEETENGISFATDVKQLQRHIGYVQLSRYLGVHCLMDTSEKLRLVDELIQRCHQSRKFGAQLLSTDVQPNDGYVLLSSHLLIDVWRETGDVEVLRRIIVHLEKALENSPSNYQIKLLLIKIYNSIGAVGLTHALYESMDIKHIQQDVLGYLVTSHIAAKGHFAQACIIFGNMLKFFTANYKDTVDYLIASYKFGSFTKIQEFVDFRERLNNSLQYTTVAVERMIQDMILQTDNHLATEQIIIYMEISPEKDKTVWEDLRDNRDLKIMISWDPPPKQITNATIKLSFNAEVEWLKLRNLLVRCLAAAHLVSRGVSGTEDGEQLNHSTTSECEGDKVKRLPPELLADLLKQMRDLVEDHKPETFALPQDPIQGPMTSRLANHLQGGYSKPVIKLFTLLLRLQKMQDHCCHSNTVENECENDVFDETIAREIKDCVSRVIGNLTPENFNSITKVANLLDDLVNTAEMLSFAAIVLGFCHQILKPVNGSRARKAKKKKDRQTAILQMPNVIEAFNRLVTDTENVTQQLHQSVRDFQLQSLVDQFSRTSLENILPENESNQLVQELGHRIEKSYQQSLTEIGDLVQNKVKYLTTLTLRL